MSRIDTLCLCKCKSWIFKLAGPQYKLRCSAVLVNIAANGPVCGLPLHAPSSKHKPCEWFRCRLSPATHPDQLSSPPFMWENSLRLKRTQIHLTESWLSCSVSSLSVLVLWLNCVKSDTFRGTFFCAACFWSAEVCTAVETKQKSSQEVLDSCGGTGVFSAS